MDIENIGNNVNGFYAFVSPAFEFDSEVMETLVMQKTILGLEDLMDPICKVRVKLMECGTTLLVEEPSLPHYFHTQPNEIF